MSYGYDASGWLSSLTDWHTDTTSFAYDADGNRTSGTGPEQAPLVHPQVHSIALHCKKLVE